MSMRDLIVAMGAAIVGFGLLLAAFAIPLSVINEYGCRSTAQAMGVPYSYSLTTDSMIKPEGKSWVPLNNYRAL